MRILLIIAALLLPDAIYAAPAREVREIKAGEPLTIRPDKAYLLLRIPALPNRYGLEPVFLRVPTKSEMEAYRSAKRAAFEKARPKLEQARQGLLAKKAAADARGEPFRGDIPPVPSLDSFNFVYDAVHNLSNVGFNKTLVKNEMESIYLVEAIPGDYVLYGVSTAAGAANLYICLCLGTVGFTAKAGEITDLGHFLADLIKSRSKVPELTAESGFGPSSDTPMVLATATVKPAGSGASIPNLLGNGPIRPADYRAIGKFIEPRAQGINRLVPVPGVLAYDEGRVIDVKSGQAVPDRY